MFTVEDRERVRLELLDVARADARLTGGAVTGSAAAGREDRWSDIDLAFGVAARSPISDVLADWTARMYERYAALHHLDVTAGAWVYRVFLLASTLQVDLAFAPEDEFGPRALTFALQFGRAVPHVAASTPHAETLVGYGWLYALHARSSLLRGRLWQAEYMVSAMRDQVLALACLRHDLPAREGRGMDRLPPELTRAAEEALVRSITAEDLSRAFQAATAMLLAEARHADPALADRIDATVRELAVPA